MIRRGCCALSFECWGRRITLCTEGDTQVLVWFNLVGALDLAGGEESAMVCATTSLKASIIIEVGAQGFEP